jgi:hypothetical protein
MLPGLLVGWWAATAGRRGRPTTYRDFAARLARDPDARCIAVRTAVQRMALGFTFTALTELREAEDLLKGYAALFRRQPYIGTRSWSSP